MQAGKKYQCSVTRPEVQETCHLSWITYRNQGQITDGENIQSVSWLESAVLRESHGALAHRVSAFDAHQRELEMGPNEQAIRDVHTTWIDAVNAGDVARLLSLMADDAVLLNPGDAPINRNAFPEGFLDAHRKFEIHCISELESIVVDGDVAYTVSKDSLSLSTRSDGQTTELAGHRLTIYCKHSDGRWLLARDANTLAPAMS